MSHPDTNINFEKLENARAVLVDDFCYMAVSAAGAAQVAGCAEPFVMSCMNEMTGFRFVFIDGRNPDAGYGVLCSKDTLPQVTSRLHRCPKYVDTGDGRMLHDAETCEKGWKA